MRALRQALAELSPEEQLTVDKLTAILLRLRFTGTVPFRFLHGHPVGFAAGREIEMSLGKPIRRSSVPVVRVEDLTTGKA